jgi:4-hydroxy-tetrahydrodipicolinate synthase
MLARDWQKQDAEARQAALDRVRQTFQKFPMIPALKAAIAQFSGDDGWTVVRPPLVALSAKQRRQLIDALMTIPFAMPGLAEVAHV